MKKFMFTFLGRRNFLTENEIFDESFLTFIFFFVNNWLPVEKVLGRRRLSLVRFLVKHTRGKCGIFEAKRRFDLGKLQILKGIIEPSQNQARSVAGSLQWVSQMCPWLRPFSASLYAFFENKRRLGEDWQKKSPATNWKFGEVS